MTTRPADRAKPRPQDHTHSAATPRSTAGSDRSPHEEFDDTAIDDVHTEADYMDQLRALHARSGISYAELSKQWYNDERFHRDAIAKSTVYELLRKDTLPRKTKQLNQLLTLLVEAYGGNPRTVRRYHEMGVRLLQARRRRPRPPQPTRTAGKQASTPAHAQSSTGNYAAPPSDYAPVSRASAPPTATSDPSAAVTAQPLRLPAAEHSGDRPATGADTRRRLGATIRNYRINRGMSLRFIAQKLGLSGHGTLVDYEHGRRIPPEDLVLAWERVLDISDGSLQKLREQALAERGEQEAERLLQATHQS